MLGLFNDRHIGILERIAAALERMAGPPDVPRPPAKKIEKISSQQIGRVDIHGEKKILRELERN